MQSFYNINPGSQQNSQPGANPNDAFRQQLIQMYLRNAMGNGGAPVLTNSLNSLPQGAGAMGAMPPAAPTTSPYGQQPPSQMNALFQNSSLPQNSMAINYLRTLQNRQSPYANGSIPLPGQQQSFL